jgi:hypothetical protein
VCPAGYVIEQEKCVPCKAGTYSEGGDLMKCRACPEGKTSFDKATDLGECFGKFHLSFVIKFLSQGLKF